jgi:cytochrome c oxidase subunit 3
MVFLIVTAVFLVRHSSVVLDAETHTYVHRWITVQLPIRLLLWNTLILALGSLTIELGRRSLAREMAVAPMRVIPGIKWDGESRMPWLAITSLLGMAFLVGQWRAWNVFRAHGFHVSTAGPSPFFYVLTGTHAVHLAVGILTLLYAASTSLLRRPIEHRRIVVEVASWYWHFMGVLWVYVFVLLQLGT